MKVFEIMIHKLRKEFKGRFVTAAELDEKHQEYTKEFLRVKELDNEVSNIISRVDLIKKNVDNAVDKKDFRYEIDKLAQNYRSLGAKLRNRSAGEQQDNNADESDMPPADLGVYEEKIGSIDDNINALREQIKTTEEKLKKDFVHLKLNKFDYSTGRILSETVEKIQSKIDDIDKSVKSIMNKMEDEVEALLIERIKPLEEDSKGHGDIILQITQRIQRMEVKIENITKSTNVQKSKSDVIDQEKLKNAENNIKTLVRDIDQIKQDLSKKVEEIMKSIYFKCDKVDVNSLETKILDNLDDLVQSMYKKFSDKNETKENLIILDRQIKNLFDLLLKKEKQVEDSGKNVEEDEAMILRKPLGGVS
mmetsp:Transcript_31003/g.35401  ORF Transcript_31003/g.35401 Transcript_31003/m.35401 type:complete len:363 (-) Transcript_31003:467-1555(-)